MGSTFSPERSVGRGLADVLQRRRSPRAYLASALSNAELNASVAQALEAHAWTCFLPQRDAPANGAAAIAAANRSGIIAADVIVTLAHRMGRDTTWEVGFAAGLGVPIVLVCARSDTPERDPMIFHAVATIARMDPGEVPALLPAFLDQWIAELARQEV